MMHFFRKFSNKSSLTLVRAAVLATAGSGILYFTSSNYDTSLSVSIPSTFWDSPSWPWRTMLLNIPSSSYTRSNHSQSDIRPFARSGAFLEPNASKVNATNADDSPKHCYKCLGCNSIAYAAAKIGPAVVNLSPPKGSYGITSGRSIGSGTIIDEDGTILTCAHVVVDSLTAEEKIEVTLQDGRSFEGTVLNVDLVYDIAIVKIESKTPLPAAKLGSSSKLRPGDWVVALGCPHFLQNTFTAGTVSCIDRKSSDLGLGGVYMKYLQTDCAINQCNSGGPLVNVEGEVVGVNVLSMLGADRLSYSIPTDSISKIMASFERKGRVVGPWVGLHMINLNDWSIRLLKEKYVSFPDVSKGVFIPAVSPGSPAERAGFHPLDIIVEVGGKPVQNFTEVAGFVRDGNGKPFEVVVKRANNVTKTLTVIPVEANSDATPDMTFGICRMVFNR